jgi:hypothetical protein
MSTKSIILIFMMLVCSGCISDYGRPDVGATPVTITNLLNDPKIWNGKVVRIVGIFNYELEGDALYMSVEDF